MKLCSLCMPYGTCVGIMDTCDVRKPKYEGIEAALNNAVKVIQAYGEDEGYIPSQVVTEYAELKHYIRQKANEGDPLALDLLQRI